MNTIPNLDYLDKLAGDDIVFRNRFIAILKEEFPLEKEEYLDHLANDRTKETAAIVHKIKHKFNILGLEVGYHLAVAYEGELLIGQKESENDFKEVLGLVEGYLKTI